MPVTTSRAAVDRRVGRLDRGAIELEDTGRGRSYLGEGTVRVVAARANRPCLLKEPKMSGAVGRISENFFSSVQGRTTALTAGSAWPCSGISCESRSGSRRPVGRTTSRQARSLKTGRARIGTGRRSFFVRVVGQPGIGSTTGGGDHRLDIVERRPQIGEGGVALTQGRRQLLKCQRERLVVLGDLAEAMFELETSSVSCGETSASWVTNFEVFPTN